MAGKKRFLLVDGEGDRLWREALGQALKSWGELDVCGEDEAIESILHRQYHLVIVDASEVQNVPLLVSRIRAHRPDTSVMVATTSPTWRRAREAFRSGASDYFRKSLDQETLTKRVEMALEKAPPGIF
jgi:DNA-binding NtrC family response regulator